METTNSQPRRFYRILGVFCTLVPYLDKPKRILHMMKFMWKDSNLFLSRNEKLFNSLFATYLYSNDPLMIKSMNDNFKASNIKYNLIDKKEIIFNFYIKKICYKHLNLIASV